MFRQTDNSTTKRKQLVEDTTKDEIIEIVIGIADSKLSKKLTKIDRA